MLSFFSLWNFRTPLLINNFREIRHVDTSTMFTGSEAPNTEVNRYFVRDKPGGVYLEYYNQKDVKIGYIRYYLTTGQIGLFFLDNEYQNRGLGKQILSKVITELKENQCEEVWAVTTTNHTFWSNVYKKSFVHRYPAHPTVGGSGYVMDIRDYNYDQMSPFHSDELIR